MKGLTSLVNIVVRRYAPLRRNVTVGAAPRAAGIGAPDPARQLPITSEIRGSGVAGWEIGAHLCVCIVVDVSGEVGIVSRQYGFVKVWCVDWDLRCRLYI